MACWFKAWYDVSPVATRSDTGSHHRLDFMRSIVPTHCVYNGHLLHDFPAVNSSIL